MNKRGNPVWNKLLINSYVYNTVRSYTLAHLFEPHQLSSVLCLLWGRRGGKDLFSARVKIHTVGLQLAQNGSPSSSLQRRCTPVYSFVYVYTHGVYQYDLHKIIFCTFYTTSIFKLKLI